MLSSSNESDKCIEKLVQCAELVIPDEAERMLYMHDILNEQINKINKSIDFSTPELVTVVDSIENPEIKVKVSQGKMKILDLIDEETTALEIQDYNASEEIAKQLITAQNELLDILIRHTEGKEGNEYIQQLQKELEDDSDKRRVVQCLQICFYTICSKNVTTLAQCMCNVYKVSNQ